MVLVRYEPGTRDELVLIPPVDADEEVRFLEYPDDEIGKTCWRSDLDRYLKSAADALGYAVLLDSNELDRLRLASPGKHGLPMYSMPEVSRHIVTTRSWNDSYQKAMGQYLANKGRYQGARRDQMTLSLQTRDSNLRQCDVLVTSITPMGRIIRSIRETNQLAPEQNVSLSFDGIWLDLSTIAGNLALESNDLIDIHVK